MANGGLHTGTPAPSRGPSDLGTTRYPGGVRLGVPSTDPGVRGRGSAPPPCSTPPLCDSSAKLRPPRTRPPPEPNGELRVGAPELGDSDEDSADPRPVRPQTLRTNPAPSVSRSCDATPLSPDEGGSFYFGGGAYEDELRGALDAGRRQSAPDKLQEADGQTDGSDPGLMPKRFGIAEFFTR